MSDFESEQWWLAALGHTLVWARLRLRAGGSAEVFDCDGNYLRYDSEDSARAALLDADFLAIDGLDGEDAERLGIDLDRVVPPSTRGGDAALGALMIQPSPPRH